MNFEGSAIQLHIGRAGANLMFGYHHAVGNKLDGFGVVGQLSVHSGSKFGSLR